MDYNDHYEYEKRRKEKQVDRFYDWYTQYDGTMKFYDCKFAWHQDQTLKSFLIDSTLIDQFKQAGNGTDCTIVCSDGQIKGFKIILNIFIN